MEQLSARLRGQTPLSLDAKGRMAIPSRYRERVSELCQGQLVVTIEPEDGCLLLYPEPYWEKIEQRFIEQSNTEPRNRNFRRLLVGYAEECEMDSQGRILLPAKLRNFAALEKKIVLVGQGNKFELWNEQAWEQRNQQLLREARENPGELAAALDLPY